MSTANLQTISSSSLARNVAAILDRVAEGESFIITRYGKAVAVLQSVTRPDRDAVNAAIDKILASRRQHPLGDVSVRELIDEGRRY